MAYSVAAEATSAAPPEVVFEHLAKAESWAVWSRVSSAARERPGVGAPDGVGSIRRVRLGPGGAREETVAYEPDRHYAYRLLSGLPIKGYRADVTLEPTPEGGTAIHWTGRFDTATIPGTGQLAHVLVGRVIALLARGVARHAERCDPACPAYRKARETGADPSA